MVQKSSSTQNILVCPPLRKALSTPAMPSIEDVAYDPFPIKLQKLAAAAKREAETPERWMCIVIRREVITKAVGRMVRLQHIPTMQPV